jgi:phosphate uptake regulator
MVFELFRGSGESQVEAIEQEIAQMLSTAAETFLLAVDALTRAVPPDQVGTTLRKRDRSINRVERSIRRQLIVHAGVRGSQADIPLLFIYMSISKDIERVGDLAKDLWDLASAGVDMSREPELSSTLAVRDTVADLVSETARVFGERDAATAVSVLNQSDAAVDRYEAEMLSQLDGDDPATAVGKALFYRYVMRITAHLMNVLTAVVMPFERLDYWDEDRIDRE